jgi:hypothetical protein
MTTAQHKAQILADIGDTRYRLNQASAEGLVVRGERPTWQINALERAGELAQACRFVDSRRMAKQFEEGK